MTMADRLSPEPMPGSYASAYARVGVESAVMGANPHRLIEMLFDGLLLQLRTARLHMKTGTAAGMAAKGQAIGKALDILNQGLLSALDFERGGEVARNLGNIYDYCGHLLLEASVRNDPDRLDEAARLLEDIGSAWHEMGKAGNSTANPV